MLRLLLKGFQTKPLDISSSTGPMTLSIGPAAFIPLLVYLQGFKKFFEVFANVGML
jgi:hypothetical protein